MTSRTARPLPPPIPITRNSQTKQVKSKSSIRSLFVRAQPVPIQDITPPQSPNSTPASPKQLTKKSNKGSTTVPKNAHLPVIPQEVFECISQHLINSHTHGNFTPLCDTCLLRDLCSLSLVTKQWLRPVQEILYTNIHIHGPDSATQLKPRFGSKGANAYGSRIKLLRRTLRTRSDLAVMVRQIKMPAYDLNLPRSEIASIHSIVASVVMTCPNLERLVGFYPTYDFGCGVNSELANKEDEKWSGGDRLWQALSTRRNLKEQVWLLTGESVYQEEPNSKHTASNGTIYESTHQELHLPRSHVEQFFSYHTNWSNLETIVLHGMTSARSLSTSDFARLFAYTPQLSSLYISHFYPHQFEDTNLQYLPITLTSLRLESLPGITDRGLFKFFSSHSLRLSKLSLINLEILSLLLIIKAFANLSHLRKFTLLQTASPTMPEDEIIFLKPLMANHKLRFLHWDCLVLGEAEKYLAESIQEGGFPALARIRAPSDESGVLQAICRPREKIELPGDKFRSLIVKQSPQKTKQAAAGYAPLSPDIPGPPNAGCPTSPTESISSNNSKLIRHLPTARASAQKRLELAQQCGSTRAITATTTTTTTTDQASSAIRPTMPTYPSFSMQIIVTNCDASSDTPPKPSVTFHSYIGTVGSQVEYYLLPDVPGSESAVVGMGDIIENAWEWRETGSSASEGCTGIWNRPNVSAQAQAAKTWWHKERIGWKKVALELLF